ncbi:MAG: hypothetical protein F6K31_36770 [Symploca sp. SIO2G7]|nr:hypothetical protein [Symploca sp. SIO2G7]
MSFVICHLSFVICHLSFVIGDKLGQNCRCQCNSSSGKRDAIFLTL